MTRKSVGVGVALAAWIMALGNWAWAQTPTPPSAATVSQPAQSAPPAQPNIVLLQPAQPTPAPPAAPAGQPPAVYVYELPPPSYAYQAPPPPPPPPPKKAKTRRGVHTHDGFYLRMGIGAGGVAVAQGKGDSADSTLSTGGAAIEFGMGGTIGEGFVVGGRVIGVGGEKLSLEDDVQRTDVQGALTYSTLQLFADWYVDPKSGLHIEGALGPAGLMYDPTVGDGRDERLEGDEVELDGFGGSLGVGFEGWVSEQWSLGGLLRLNWATFDGRLGGADAPLLTTEETQDDGSGRVIAVAPMLMLTGTYH